MSDPTAVVPPGWYPDPQDASRGRYWDGAAWTDLVHRAGEPFPASPPLKAPPGTDWNTPWVWVLVFVPLVTYIPLMFLPWDVFSTIDPNRPTSIIEAEIALFLSPAYIIAILLSFVVWGLSILGAILDHREFTRRGVPKPFHWAFVFLGGVVYTIGRSVVVHRRTGKGHAPLFAEIGVLVLSLLFATLITVFAVQAIFSAVANLTYYS